MTIGRIPSVEGGIQPTIVDAKGDLIAGVAADSVNRLAVGSNDQVLVADSGATTGMAWKPYGAQFVAGKNKIINGDFYWNQRNFSTDAVGTYGFDRWAYAPSGATGTYSAQTFTLGAAPVAGYEAINFARLAVTTGNDNARLEQKIESVRTFAGETITLSFWAKGTNPTSPGYLTSRVVQFFGTGGSPSSQVTSAEQTFVLTANWTRYSFTFAVPSISGKTIGTTPETDYFAVWIGQGSSASTDAWTLDLWGVQVESGNVATAFQTATGNRASELAACQRYYQRVQPGGTLTALTTGFALSTTAARGIFPYPVQMRTAPTALEVSGTATDYSVQTTSGNTDCSVVPALAQATIYMISVSFTVASGLTGGQGLYLRTGSTTNGFLGWSAEL
jgi:hypothetical protein